MKTELIEYHRECAKAYREVAEDIDEADFHERAVAWLEGLQEPESLTVRDAYNMSKLHRNPNLE